MIFIVLFSDHTTISSNNSFDGALLVDLQKFESKKPTPSKDEAKKQLIHLLQMAHSGEKAAANAYYGHYKSWFIKNSTERAEVKKIYEDELHHRQRLKEILAELGAKPKLRLEIMFFSIGFTIGFLCLFGGWFIPMYGAGKLESTNIAEYEVAARLAHLAGLNKYIPELLVFAEIEWDHELYFRNKAESHFLYKLFPKWTIPKERKLISVDMNTYQSKFS